MADLDRGIICLIGGTPEQVISFASGNNLTLFVHAATRDAANAIRRRAKAEKLLGGRIFVAEETGGRIPLADNLADRVVVFEKGKISEEEILRSLRPRGIAFFGDRKIVKPVPDGYDEWTHPFHGPDNNPQSRDRHARGRFRTQFIAGPKFSPMPEQSVIGGGRIYKAMGHIAHKANQNEMLNTLLGINAYNGTILWQRPLPAGFMIHRNTMIATGDALLLGDDESCKIIDGETGDIRREITITSDISDGPVWKWMAMKDGVLYALAGNPEVRVDTEKSDVRGMGHWPWGMWKGHEYADPRTSFGFGRTLVAIDLETGRRLWQYRDPEFLDARAVCMNDENIFCYAPEKFLAAIDRKTGRPRWRNSDETLLAALGPNAKAQHYVTGYATTTYLKCNDDRLFFAGPQRERMVVASAEDGCLMWTHEVGNLQLVLRDDGIYAAGPQKTSGGILDYATGKMIREFVDRRACTRATGSLDSVFFRASGGTVRVLTETNSAQHIAPMRPPCQDGVLISNGHLYWGPWMCGCQLSLYGNIALAPQTLPGEADAAPDPEEIYREALTVFSDSESVAALNADDNDWMRYRGDDGRSGLTPVAIPEKVTLKWRISPETTDLLTAPVAAGGLVFVADRNGVLHALDAENGETVWENFTAGPIYYPPAISLDRLFAGSADGKVYAFEAKTGRLLWTFRAGPETALIPVFGKLVSSWPVAGGVAVKDDTVYAAAGITHYDGTYVVAIDARNGELKARNTTSGVIASEVDNGISLQGNLRIVDGELQFLGGGVYETARYDLTTLACLNEPKVQVTSQYRTAFYPYYPEYNKYVSLEYRFPDGRVLNYDANYEGLYFNNLALLDSAPLVQKDAAGEFIRMQNRRRGKDAASDPKPIWQDQANRRFTSLILQESGARLLAAGHPDEKPAESFLTLIDVETGEDLWNENLPAPAVKGGTAIDAKGRIFVVLENGEVRCFAEMGTANGRE